MKSLETIESKGFLFVIIAMIMPVVAGACGKQVPDMPTITFDATDTKASLPGVSIGPSQGDFFSETGICETKERTRQWDITLKISGITAKVRASWGPSGPTHNVVHVLVDTAGPICVRVIFDEHGLPGQSRVSTKILGKGHHDLQMVPCDAVIEEFR